MNEYSNLDLIHGVIAQSGSMLADWALDRQARKHGLRIAELTGCPMEPYSAQLDCLRNVDVEVLVRAESQANVSYDITFEAF